MEYYKTSREASEVALLTWKQLPSWVNILKVSVLRNKCGYFICFRVNHVRSEISTIIDDLVGCKITFNQQRKSFKKPLKPSKELRPAAAGTKNAAAIDALEQGVKWEDFRLIFRKPNGTLWTTASIKAFLYQQIPTYGYGIQYNPETLKFSLIYPPGVNKPLPHVKSLRTKDRIPVERDIVIEEPVPEEEKKLARSRSFKERNSENVFVAPCAIDVFPDACTQGTVEARVIEALEEEASLTYLKRITGYSGPDLQFIQKLIDMVKRRGYGLSYNHEQDCYRLVLPAGYHRIVPHISDETADADRGRYK